LTIYKDKMLTEQRIRTVSLVVCIAFLFCMAVKLRPTLPELASSNGKNPASYLVEKAASHRLILLGTRHDNTQIHDLILDILPGLAKEAGITTLFVEIPSNQQGVIEGFRKGLCPASDIKIHEIIASHSYLKIIARARDLGMEIIAIDNDENEQVTRDRWMASRVSDYLALHPGSKGLVVVGNCHVFKNVEWAYDGYPSLADYLQSLKPFSVVMWPGAIERGLPLALDIDHHTFLGLKDPTLACMNILPQTCLATSADGVILLADDGNGALLKKE
jgi:hypothetical protein